MTATDIVSTDVIKMNAVIFSEYGSPDVLKATQVDKPVPGDDEVLIKILASSVNAGDWHLLRGEPFLVRLMFGLFRPRQQILGADLSGKIVAVGKNVHDFKVGDEIFGDISNDGFGTFAEYVAVSPTRLAAKPAGLSFEAAAAVPEAAVTALQSLRDHGKLQPGQKVLVNGASGGVGSFAVQIAKALGAEVTAVGSGNKMAMLESLGADTIIDYRQEDVTQNGKQYDLIIDAAAFRPVSDFIGSLTKSGTYVLVGGSTERLFKAMLAGLWYSLTGRKKIKTFLANPNRKDLEFLTEIIEAGKIKPAIDTVYPLASVAEGIRDLEERRVKGKVVIKINQ